MQTRMVFGPWGLDGPALPTPELGQEGGSVHPVSTPISVGLPSSFSQLIDIKTPGGKVNNMMTRLYPGHEMSQF